MTRLLASFRTEQGIARACSFLTCLTVAGLFVASQFFAERGGTSSTADVAPAAVIPPGQAAMPVPSIPAIEPAKPVVMKHEVDWSKVSERVADAEIEAVIHAGQRIESVKAFFDSRKSRAASFAETVLGIEGKAVATGTAVDEVLDSVVRLFGAGPPHAADRLTLFLRQNLETHILHPSQVESELQAAFRGAVQDIEGIDSRLLVDVRADFSDDELADFNHPPALHGEVSDSRHFSRATGTIFEAAAEDLYVSTGNFAFSWWAGDKLAGSLTGNLGKSRVEKAAKWAIGLGSGEAVSLGNDALIAAAGHDPKAKIAATVEKSLDIVSDRVIGGDSLAASLHRKYELLADGHPDQAVRGACREAADAIERVANLGLQYRLFRNISRHYSNVRVSLYRHFFGVDAPLPIELLPVQVIDTDAEDRRVFIETARNITNTLRGAVP